MKYDYDERPSISDFFYNLWQKISNLLCFAIENARPRYTFSLVGEKFNNQTKQTLLLYKVKTKRPIFEITASELCNTKEFISKFEPLDVRVISFIAGMEQLLDIPEQSRTEVFLKLKALIFNR